MRYITEQECYEHEKQIRQNKENEEKLREEKQNKLNIINREYEELQNLLSDNNKVFNSEFEKDYGVRQRPYVAPFYKILDMPCR